MPQIKSLKKLIYSYIQNCQTLSLYLPVDSPAQVSRTSSGFSEAMSNDEFMNYLKEEGLLAMDCSKLIGMPTVVFGGFFTVGLKVKFFNLCYYGNFLNYADDMAAGYWSPCQILICIAVDTHGNFQCWHGDCHSNINLLRILKKPYS